MQAVKFLLLLTPYATVVTATLAWHYHHAASFPTTDVYCLSYSVMEDAIKFYNTWVAAANLSTPDMDITIIYNKNVKKMGWDRVIETIYWGPDDHFYNKEWVIHFISHVLGVGGTNPNWISNCPQHTLLNFPKTLKMMRYWNGPQASFYCDSTNFKPYGLNHAYEFDKEDTNAIRHVQLVASMISEGLRKGIESRSVDPAQQENIKRSSELRPRVNPCG